ncbi:MAG: hypothetical protein PHX52_00155 [Candidatus Pacebacteria bacterium]|nr:hypothetical protein [Candidatus Paceibacterota bacterium]MDD3918977.1 hypothetical protein [Candidatus Paceibacterota bacterium]
MFKKITILTFSLLFIFNINYCKAETIEEIAIEDGQEIAEQLIDKVFSIEFLNEIKNIWDENFSIYYEWFKANIGPKIANAVEKVTATEEYNKEKEDLENELPGVIEKIFNFFKEKTETTEE